MPRRNRTHQARRKRTTARLYAVVNEPTPDWGGGSSANPPTSCDDTATAKTPPPIATDVPAPPPTPRPTPTPPGTRRGRSRSGSPTQSPPLQPLSAEHLLALVTAALGEIPVLPVHLDHAAHADADLIEYRRCNKTGRDKARRFLVQAEPNADGHCPRRPAPSPASSSSSSERSSPTASHWGTDPIFGDPSRPPPIRPSHWGSPPDRWA